MENPPRPQLLDFIQQAIACCRTNASFSHVPEFARERLREAGDNIEFFLQHREFTRAFQEAALATGINTAVVRFIQASAEATSTLRQELGDE